MGLEPAATYRYLRNSASNSLTTAALDGIDDLSNFSSTEDSIEKLKFTGIIN